MQVDTRMNDKRISVLVYKQMPSGRQKNIRVGWPWKRWRNQQPWRRTKPGIDYTIPAAAVAAAADDDGDNDDDDDDDEDGDDDDYDYYYDDGLCLATRSSLAMNCVKSWSHAACL